MSLYKEFISEKCIWGIWKVTESLDELLALLPDKGVLYLNDLNEFKSPSRKVEWLAVRVLFYTLTGKLARIKYHPSGKPYLANSESYISISHTKGYVSVIISTESEVGIDIEKMGHRVHKVAHKYVRDDEFLPEDYAQRTIHLLLIWSAKEVMFKCVNEDAFDFREHMYVDLPRIDGTQFAGTETRSELKQKFTIYYMVDPDFVMTWTTI